MTRLASFGSPKEHDRRSKLTSSRSSMPSESLSVTDSRSSRGNAQHAPDAAGTSIQRRRSRRLSSLWGAEKPQTLPRSGSSKSISSVAPPRLDLDLAFTPPPTAPIAGESFSGAGLTSVEKDIIDQVQLTWPEVGQAWRVVSLHVDFARPGLLRSRPPSPVSSSEERLRAIFVAAVRPAQLPQFPSLATFFPPPTFTHVQHDFLDDFSTAASWSDAETLCSFLKWTLRCLKGKELDSLPIWYQDFAKDEIAAHLPLDAYARIAGDQRHRALTCIIDFISEIIARQSDLPLRHLTNQLAWYLLEQRTPTSAHHVSFKDFIGRWQAAAAALDHLVLARIRARADTPAAIRALADNYPQCLDLGHVSERATASALVLKLERRSIRAREACSVAPQMLLEAMLDILDRPKETLASSLPPTLAQAIRSIFLKRTSSSRESVDFAIPAPASPISAQFAGTSSVGLANSSSLRSLASIAADEPQVDWDGFSREGFSGLGALQLGSAGGSSARSTRPIRTDFSLCEVIVEEVSPHFVAFMQDAMADRLAYQKWPFEVCMLGLDETLPAPFAKCDSIIIQYTFKLLSPPTPPSPPIAHVSPVTFEATKVEPERPKSSSWARRASQQMVKRKSFLSGLTTQSKPAPHPADLRHEPSQASLAYSEGTRTDSTAIPTTPTSTISPSFASGQHARRSMAPSPATLPNTNKQLPQPEETDSDAAGHSTSHSSDSRSATSAQTRVTARTFGQAGQAMSREASQMTQGGNGSDDDDEQRRPRRDARQEPEPVSDFVIHPAPKTFIDSNAPAPALKIAIGMLAAEHLGRKVRVYGACSKYLPSRSLLLLKDAGPLRPGGRLHAVAVDISIILAGSPHVTFHEGETLCVVGNVERCEPLEVDIGDAFEIVRSLRISAILITNPDRREQDLPPTPQSQVELGPVL